MARLNVTATTKANEQIAGVTAIFKIAEN